MSFISEFFEGIAQFTVPVPYIFVIDPILGSLSVPGIDFYPLKPSKNFASGYGGENQSST
jgi:hypothetical protein